MEKIALTPAVHTCVNGRDITCRPRLNCTAVLDFSLIRMAQVYKIQWGNTGQ